MKRDKKARKFCVSGSAQIGRNNNANRRAEKWNDYIKRGGKISLFLPLYRDENDDISIAMAGAYCHSIPQSIRNDNAGLPGMIISTVERDPENGSILPDEELDIFAKLAVIAKIAFNGEKAKALNAIENTKYTTQEERDFAMEKWTKDYMGVQEEGRSYKTRGKQPAFGYARMINYAVGIACATAATGKLDAATAKLVYLMPSSKRVDLFNSALNRLKTQYMANKNEDPNAKEPTVLELIFDIDDSKNTDEKKQQVEPSGGDYLTGIEIQESRAKELESLKPLFSILPKSGEECFDRNRGFDEKDGASILLNFKMILLDGLSHIDLITDQDDKDHIERNVSLIRDVFTGDARIEDGLKALNIQETTQQADAIKDEINKEYAEAAELAKTVGTEGIVGEILKADETQVTPVSAPTSEAPAASVTATTPTPVQEATTMPVVTPVTPAATATPTAPAGLAMDTATTPASTASTAPAGLEATLEGVMTI